VKQEIKEKKATKKQKNLFLLNILKKLKIHKGKEFKDLKTEGMNKPQIHFNLS